MTKRETSNGSTYRHQETNCRHQDRATLVMHRPWWPVYGGDVFLKQNMVDMAMATVSLSHQRSGQNHVLYCCRSWERTARHPGQTGTNRACDDSESAGFPDRTGMRVWILGKDRRLGSPISEDCFHELFMNERYKYVKRPRRNKHNSILLNVPVPTIRQDDRGMIPCRRYITIWLSMKALE